MQLGEDASFNQAIRANVSAALAEDVGPGDVSATLIDDESLGNATVITRTSCVVCGRPWIEEVARQLNHAFQITWVAEEGQHITPDQEICSLKGSAPKILTAERTMLNFLQLLSATATITRTYCEKIAHTKTRILDTRKTVPGLRMAQKYAVSVGGGLNHRYGLFDAFLIKENHIEASGSIKTAVERARKRRLDLLVEVEVETLQQLAECIELGVRRVLLDNFTLDEIRQAVSLSDDRVELEASGGITLENIASIADTGVDYISVGALTKDIKSVDLSLRFS